MFEILMGIPEMKAFWDDLKHRKKEGSLSGDDKDLFKKFGKAIQSLAADPRHRGCRPMKSGRCAVPALWSKAFQSYLGKGKIRVAAVLGLRVSPQTDHDYWDKTIPRRQQKRCLWARYVIKFTE